MTVPDGVDYEAMDGEPSDVFFYDRSTSRRKRRAFRGIVKIICDLNGSSISCPTGIAHTFMAAESIENKAKEMGITLKAETNGSGGAKNVLTKEEIENCDGIIVAADKNVEMARFDGKQVLQTKVADGINKPEELIQTILDKKAPTYHHSGAAAQEDSAEGESVERQIYKHLMNGVSHMLPFVIGGGILIALAFLVDNQAINPANFGKNTPLAALLKTIGEQAFGFMLPILAGFIAMSIADRPGLAVGFVGGYIMVLLRKPATMYCRICSSRCIIHGI